MTGRRSKYHHLRIWFGRKVGKNTLIDDRQMAAADAGGSHEDMLRLNEARDQLKSSLTPGKRKVKWW
jgi:hypothetical protein